MNNKDPKIDLEIVVFVSIVGTFVFAYASYILNLEKFPGSFISIWKIWDTPHYLNIVKYGYTDSTLEYKQVLIAFFPLYPLLIKIFSFILQNYLL